MTEQQELTATTQRPRYAPFCRTRTFGPHTEPQHHDLVECDCPCHGGDAPWWSDTRSSGS